MAGLAGPDAQADGEVGLAGAGRAEEHDVVAGLDEVEGAEVGDDVALRTERWWSKSKSSRRLAGREAGGADAGLAAVGLAGCDLPLQAGGEELLMASSPRPGPARPAARPPASSEGALSARHR